MEDGQREILRKPVGLVLALAALFSVTSSWQTSRLPQSAGIDFYQFWVVGQTLEHEDATRIYEPDERARLGEAWLRAAETRAPDTPLHRAAKYRRVLETYSTPFLYSGFRWLAPDDYFTAYALFHAVSAVLVAVAVFVFVRAGGGSVPCACAAVVAIAMWFAPLDSDIRVGNVNRIQLGLLASVLLLLGRPGPYRDAAAGALLGVAVGFKPNLALVALLVGLMRLTRDRRPAALRLGAGLAVGGLASFLVAAATFGTAACWTSWIDALRSLPPETIPIRFGNYSVAMQLESATGFAWSVPLAAAGLGLAAGALWRARGARAGDDVRAIDLGAVSLGCLVYLLSGRLVWLHYYVLAVPAVAFALGTLPRERSNGALRPTRALLVAVALTLVALQPLINVFSIGPHGRLAMLTTGAVLLFGLALHRLIGLGASAA